MIERVVLISLGVVGLIGAYYGAKSEGWFRVVGEFPFLFSAVWVAVVESCSGSGRRAWPLGLIQ